MKVTNMTSSKGNKIANQFIMTDSVNGWDVEVFQSYDSIITKRVTDQIDKDIIKVSLDRELWNYSTTTGKYRNQFLGEGISETRKKIESGEYILTDLN